MTASAQPAVWAGLDIGTNSVKLLVGRVALSAPQPTLEVLLHEVRVTRMGEGLQASGALGDAPMQRAIDAIRALAEAARPYAPVGVSALGMEAFRRATNGPALARRIETELGIPTRILRGDEEARLGRAGVLLGFGAPLEAPVLVLDVGGGSSELALTEPEWQVSLPRGAVVTSEAFLHADPPTPDEMARMRASLVETFADAWRGSPLAGVTPASVVAVGGTVTTLAAVHLKLEAWDADRVHRTRLTRDDIRALTDRLASMPLATRRTVAGLHPDRAPVIVGGGAIVESILSVVGAPALHVSVANVLHAHVVTEVERWGRGERASAV